MPTARDIFLVRSCQSNSEDRVGDLEYLAALGTSNLGYNIMTKSGVSNSPVGRFPPRTVESEIELGKENYPERRRRFAGESRPGRHRGHAQRRYPAIGFQHLGAH